MQCTLVSNGIYELLHAEPHLGKIAHTAIAANVRSAPRKLGTKMKYFPSVCMHRKRT